MDGSAVEWTALELHAMNCPECAEELRIWKSMSTAASELRREWETPYLWTKIERGLAEQMTEKPSRFQAWLNAIGLASVPRQAVAALLVLALVLARLGRFFTFHPVPDVQSS